ncbi:MAG: hypothetical protein Q7U60_08260 [Candidatus Methanoperedens sp.]|nr:hypothetical protein [Candidatus Methanoperedens sp.]
MFVCEKSGLGEGIILADKNHKLQSLKEVIYLIVPINTYGIED